MLVIRLQRTGRKGHAMFRVVVQDSRWTPSSGKVVARLGSYDPHAKTTILDKEKVKFYLEHGAQPSERLTRIIKNEGVDLPNWVKQSVTKESTTRNPDKRRSTRPEEPKAEEETPPIEEIVNEEPTVANSPVEEEAKTETNQKETEESETASEPATDETTEPETKAKSEPSPEETTEAEPKAAKEEEPKSTETVAEEQA
jgi:small subunit ribosomal protein S16